ASALEQMRPEYSPEVLSQKARDLIHHLGYANRSADDAYGFSWERAFVRYIEENDKPFPHWDQVLSRGPSLLRFWYRQSPQPLVTTDFIDDLLTPGIVTPEQPPSDQSGMIDVALDYEGRLVSFHAMPPQRQE